ncbi:MAG: homoserine dehydrogenase [Acidimicrobiales bacterium]
MDQSVVRVGVLGCGTVGASLLALVQRQNSTIQSRTGLSIEISGVAVRDLGRNRSIAIDSGTITNDAMALVADPSIDVIVEVMGGITPARELILAALAAGKPVITANKALLAAHGSELFAAADASGVDLLFEASVAGGIPFLRPLRESLLAEPITCVMGIMNGTTNYILTRMSEAGADYADALAEAQALGYAEADPTADVEGHDAAAKIAIVASIAFGAEVTIADVQCEGIAKVSSGDIAFAKRHGYVIKLLAIAELFSVAGGRELSARVHPSLIPVSHPLAAVRDSFNAVFVQGDAVGDLMFFGRGAGGDPTASAVLGDLVDAAQNLRRGAHASLGSFIRLPVRPGDDLAAAWYLSLLVDDRPGVLAAVAGVFSDYGLSIDSMEQHSLSGPDHAANEARIDLIIHPALEREVRATLVALHALEAVRTIGSTIRVLVEGNN